MDRKKSYGRMARDLWPRAEWIRGRGPWAVVANCRGTTVTLWISPDKAAEAIAWINEFGCGGRCRRNHFVRRLSVTPNHEVKF